MFTYDEPPTMFLNTGSNSRNSFLILANGWLSFSLQCSDLCLFLCFHWHFNGKLKESINRMANLMLLGPTTLSTIFSKIKTEALVNWSGFSHWIGSQWISSGNFNTMQLLDAYQIITINLNYSFYFYKDVPPEWWS